jgi:nitrogen-specific signal transduction histidine kinase
VVLKISDTGSGMSEEVRQRCLEPFFTTKGDRGTGLGLSMVFGIIQRHGGDIEIQTAPGQGTTFIWNPAPDLARKPSNRFWRHMGRSPTSAGNVRSNP